MPDGAGIMLALGAIETCPGQADACADAAWTLKTISPATDAANPILANKPEVIGRT
jgi:hypothetical protein